MYTGRRSDLPRQTVLEVVDYDPDTNTSIIARIWEAICHQVGDKVDGSEDDYRNIGEEVIPFVVLRQIEVDPIVKTKMR
jgi:hypothetical protein